MSKGVKVVDTLYDHDTPGEFIVDVGERLTVHLHKDSEYHFESFCVNIKDIMDAHNKIQVLLYLLGFCDKYPDNKLTGDEIKNLLST